MVMVKINSSEFYSKCQRYIFMTADTDGDGGPVDHFYSLTDIDDLITAGCPIDLCGADMELVGFLEPGEELNEESMLVLWKEMFL
jgi:hypothetical protein